MKNPIVISIILAIISLSPESGICQSKELDKRIIGKWTILFFTDAEGNILDNGFAGKNYVDVFDKNGTFSIDPNIFRDEMKKHGINGTVDYSAIPVFTWKTNNNQVLIIDTNMGSQQIRYGFSGDTLLLGYPNGNIRYLLKRN